MENKTDKSEMMVQIPAFAHELNKNLAKQLGSRRKVVLAAAVLAFDSLDPQEKAKWISATALRNLGQEV